MDELISREAVLRLIENKPYDWSNLTERHNMLSEIRKLPSVTQKSGKWIRSIIYENTYNCSKCGSAGYDTFKYCPNCGAKMVEPQESEVNE